MDDDDATCEVNVQVAVRCRPMNGKELTEGSSVCVEFPSSTQVVLHKMTKGAKDTHQYAFDNIFSMDSAQSSVYLALGVPLLDKAFEGYNSTIFAYGQTGSGKTFTMMNHRAGQEDRGLIPRISDGLYQRIGVSMAENESRRFLVCCSFLEIYNEIIFDLLVPRSKQAKGGLEVREQKGMGVYVKDLTEMVVETGDRLNTIIENGFEHRTTAATKMNEGSSRSHCIFVIKLHQKDAQDESKNTFSKLNLVDLAGSERAKSTEAEGDRLKEGANINKSLSALGNVINALSSISGGNKKVFVPYRNSKLTRVLQESLGGNSLCCMVATMSPAATNIEETLSTLNYAKRAKTIKVTATKNDEASQIRKLEDEVEALRRKLANQAGAGTAGLDAGEKRELEQKFEAQISEMQSFMKQSWEEKQKLSMQYEEDQKRQAEDAAKAREKLINEKKRRLQLLEQNGDLNLSLQALQALGNSKLTGFPEKIAEALKVESTLRAQLRAVKLFRDSAASDFGTCAGCKVTDVVAIITLLNQVHAKLGSMSTELSTLGKYESQYEEHFAQATPELALALREAQAAAASAKEDDDTHHAVELVELLTLVQKQLSQHQAKVRASVLSERRSMGFGGEFKWLLQCLDQDGASPTSSRQGIKKALQMETSAGGAGKELAPAFEEKALGLSTFELPDSRLCASSNSDQARSARLMQMVMYGGWAPATASSDEYLEIDLGEEQRVLSISVQGRLPATSEWMQTRDLLQSALKGVADKLPTSEKVYKRPPVRLIHDVGIALGHERKCFDGVGGWELSPELLTYGDLSRDQKVTFFDQLIGCVNKAWEPAQAKGLPKLTITAQDILSGKRCEDSNLLLQLLAYLSLFSVADRSSNGLANVVPQWTKAFKLSYWKSNAWKWLGDAQGAGASAATVFEGNSDTSSVKIVKLPEPLATTKLRLHPCEWEHHAGLRCEVHIASALGGDAASGSASSRGASGSSLEDCLDLACRGIHEVRVGIEERKQAKQKEDEDAQAKVMSLKDKAEQERDQLEKSLKDALEQVEQLSAANTTNETRASKAETELLQLTVEKERLGAHVEQLSGDLAVTTEKGGDMDEQLTSLREEAGDLKTNVEDLEGQLQTITEERDLARQKEEELFELLTMKEEDLMDTNNGYVYLTERLQEKEEEQERLQEDFDKLHDAHEKLDDRQKELSDEVIQVRGECQQLRIKLGEEERMHKASQDRYMKLLKDGIGGGASMSGTVSPARTTASTRPESDAQKSESASPPKKKPDGYEDDFEMDQSRVSG